MTTNQMKESFVRKKKWENINYQEFENMTVGLTEEKIFQNK